MKKHGFLQMISMNRTLSLTSILFLAFAASGRAQLAQPDTAGAPEPSAPVVQDGDRTSKKSAHTFQIARDGKALAPIVVAADASPEIKATAAYLAEKLEKISGAKFEVQTGDGKSGIVVGTHAQFPVASLKNALAKRSVLKSSEIESGEEAFAIHTEASRVLLLGGGETGASHAVSRFLEVLGYRQFFPGAAWEIAPTSPSLQWNWDETDRPTMLTRHIWFNWGYPTEPVTMGNLSWKPAQRVGPARREIENWYRQNRWGKSLKSWTAHNWASIIGKHQAEFAAHPEYLSLVRDGATKEMKRLPLSLCVSNPAVRAFAAQDAIAYFDKNPAAEMFSLERGDGDATCLCENCKALGSESERVFGLANEVARALRAKHPGKMVGILAYNLHNLPPNFPMEPNVHVQVARIFIRSKTPYQDLLKQWRAKTANLGAREYFSTYVFGQDRLRAKDKAGPTANLALLQSDIALFHKLKMLNVWSESSIAWGAHGRGNYIAPRLLWNPDANVDALLQDFYDRAFGPAAPAMKKYFERADGGNDVEPTPASYLALMDDLQAASDGAKDRPDVLARIAQLKRFMIFNGLQYRVLREKSLEARRSLFLEQYRHEFRTRFEYTTHWEGTHSMMGRNKIAEKSWLQPPSKEYVRAKKEGREIPDPPWLDWNPYTPDETEARFEETRKFFQAQPVS